MLRAPFREKRTICTARAPDAVLTCERTDSYPHVSAHPNPRNPHNPNNNQPPGNPTTPQ